MPVFCVKRGSKRSNSPLSFVDVVEATTIDRSYASACPAMKAQKTAMKANLGFRSASKSGGASLIYQVIKLVLQSSKSRWTKVQLLYRM